MNSRAKGKRIEREWNELLLKHGFQINPCAPGTKWNRQTDHWGGRFDVEAIDHNGDMHFFQVSTAWKSGKDRKHLESFNPPVCGTIWMVRKKGRCDFELKWYNLASKVWIGHVAGEWLALND